MFSSSIGGGRPWLMILFVLFMSLFSLPLPLSLARCAGFNVCGQGVSSSAALSTPLHRGRGRGWVCYPSHCRGAGGGSVSYRKDTTSEGRFANFRAHQFEINKLQHVTY